MTTLPFFSLPLQYNLSTKTDTEDDDEDAAILSGKRHECRDRYENLSFLSQAGNMNDHWRKTEECVQVFRCMRKYAFSCE